MQPGKIKILHKNQSINKHISTIHCSNSLSLLQRKISNVLLFNAYPKLLSEEEHQISIKDICNHIEYNGYNYDSIKNALKILLSTVLEWNVINETVEEDWTASSILASVNIKQSVCTYSYSPRMRQLLYSPSIYGKINLSIQANFSSNYGLALYENCVRYRNICRTKEFSMDVFKKIMGVSANKYLIFRDLKKRVIDKAVQEVNLLSDFIVTPNIKKVGRRAVSIYFDIKDKSNNSKLIINDATQINNVTNQSKNKDRINNHSETSLLINQLQNEFFLNQNIIDDLLRRFGIENIKSKIKHIKQTSSFINGKISNLPGFLVDSLNKDYTPIKSSAFILEEKRKNKEQEELNMKEKKKIEQNLMKKYELIMDRILVDFLNNVDKKNLDTIEKEFREYLINTSSKMVLAKFNKAGYENKIVRIYLRLFLNSSNFQCAPRFISLENFIKQQEI